jgi:rhomboid protease GluP
MAMYSPNQIQKLQLIYLPFLKVSLSFITTYTFLHWYFIIHLDLFLIEEKTVNAWIPAILSWGLILIFLRSKARLLALKDRLPDFIIILMLITTLAPTVILQFYVVTATGKLTVLNDISEKSSNKPTKYYIIRDHFINKRYTSFKPLVNIGGKGNRDYNMYLYCALPILKSEADTNLSVCENWYCIKYYERISNRHYESISSKLNSEIKKQKFDIFLKKSLAKFDSLNVNNFVYLNRIEQVFDKNGYCQAIENNTRFTALHPTILLPINEPFKQRNGTKLYWFLGTLIALNLSLILFIISHDLKENIALE